MGTWVHNLSTECWGEIWTEKRLVAALVNRLGNSKQYLNLKVELMGSPKSSSSHCGVHWWALEELMKMGKVWVQGSFLFKGSTWTLLNYKQMGSKLRFSSWNKFTSFQITQINKKFGFPILNKPYTRSGSFDYLTDLRIFDFWVNIKVWLLWTSNGHYWVYMLY